VSLAVCLLLTSTAFAQPKIALPAPKVGKFDALVPVMAQSPRVLAVSDTHSMLAFGLGKNANAQVLLVKLDAKGTPAAYGTEIKLPKPPGKGLEKNKTYVTGVAFHPKLPVLYAWQDIDVYFTNPVPPATPAEMKVFDHLWVINFAKDPPVVTLGVCRGDEFIFGQGGGSLAVDPTGSYLYVPNVREIKNPGSQRLGRYPLDADGLPVVTQLKDPLPARVKKIEELNAAGKFSPPQMTPIEYVHLFALNAFGAGHTFIPVGKDVVLSSGNQGLMSWRPEEKHAILHALPLKFAGHTQFTIHPTLPALFSTASYAPPGIDSFFRAEQVEGYLTGLPKQYVIEKSHLTGFPAVLAKQKKLLVGGQYSVYVMDLDDKGFPTGTPTQVLVNIPQVRGMVTSERFERVYVGVEVSR
jgi:hypothetical protein